jgi:hypothetical protein
LAGFGLFLLAMVRYFENMVLEISDMAPRPSLAGWGKLGLALFCVSWIWSWFTSISLVREAERHRREHPAPPKLR